jgi:hypothetical protein
MPPSAAPRCRQSFASMDPDDVDHAVPGRGASRPCKGRPRTGSCIFVAAHLRRAGVGPPRSVVPRFVVPMDGPPGGGARRGGRALRHPAQPPVPRPTASRLSGRTRRIPSSG